MDPNAAYQEFRDAYSDWEDTRGKGEDLEAAVTAADRMREAMVNLDLWLRMGGALPDAWTF